MEKNVIRIGTCVKGSDFLSELPWVVRSGFESVELYLNDTLCIDFSETPRKAGEIIGDSGVKITSIGFYCNPLADENARAALVQCIKNARRFGAGIVATFAGALPGLAVDETIPKFKDVFTELCRIAQDYGIRLAIEGAPMHGHWYAPTCNIGFCPRAWEMMFDAVPCGNFGLEWESAHQIQQMIDPIACLRTWLPRIVHLHGKCARLDREHIRKYGAWFGEHYCEHCFPGLGECDWSEILRILSDGGYEDDICIEGWHDKAFMGSKEHSGQILALEYLRKCRGANG